MRAVFVDTTIGGGLIGGAQTFLVGFIGGLAERGHSVYLLSGGEPNPRVASAITSGGANVNNDIWNGSALVEDAAPRVSEWINRLNPDVYVVSVSPDIGWAVLPMLDPGIATLTIGHNDEETFYAPVRHYRQFLTRAIGVSDEICRKYVSECGMAEEAVSWIPYGVEVMDEPPAEFDGGPLRLIYVGRLDEVQKRISDVVAVVRGLNDAEVDFVIDIVGDGPRREFVEGELADLIAAGKVRMHGWLSAAEVIAAMRQSEVFILASAYEGFCISLTEAMANGCLPIVTDIDSGNKQLVNDNVNGFVVPIGDIEAFIDKITVLAKDRELLIRLRLAAWETGRKYSIDRMVENYIGCFEEAIEEARLKPRTPDADFPLMPSCRSRYPLWLRRIKARVVGSR